MIWPDTLSWLWDGFHEAGWTCTYAHHHSSEAVPSAEHVTYVSNRHEAVHSTGSACS